MPSVMPLLNRSGIWKIVGVKYGQAILINCLCFEVEKVMIEIGSNLTELLKYIVMVVGIVLVIYFMVTNL